ncbi:AraC family transcriptional regulator [Streptomyces scopuliridis]|uniref:helix-turn-helix transcriptional regulator n=1 Tax=Streptomyces scopuliridis TaxID=452529 RepID=UPI0036CE733A
MASERRLPRYGRASVFHSDGLPVWASQHRLDPDVPAHDHDFFEIALVVHGHGIHKSAEGDHVIGPGSVVIMPPNQWHAYLQVEDLVVFDSYIAPELLDTTLSFLDAELPLMWAVHSTTVPVPQRLRLQPDDISSAVTQLHGIADVSAERSRITITGRLLIYLGILNHAWSSQSRTHLRSLAPLHPGVARAVELLDANPGHAWTLAELAAATATQHTYLIHLFQRDLAVSPIAYLIRLREQIAARRLVQTDEPIAHIAAQLGWQDAAYFARRFKSTYGMSPSTYRKQAYTGMERAHPIATAKPRFPSREAHPQDASHCPPPSPATTYTNTAAGQTEKRDLH